MKLNHLLSLGLVMASLLMARETLNIDFTTAKTLTAAGKSIAITGTENERGLAFGEYGLAIPGTQLVGNDQGSILFVCSFDKPGKEVRGTLPVVQLRTGSRLTAGFHTFGNRILVFDFTNRDKSYTIRFEDKHQMLLEPEREYMLGFTWDGMRVRVYLDGRVIGEAEQPLTMKNIVRNLNIGPYKDGWLAPQPWEDDMHIKSLRVFNTAVTPEEVAKLYGKTLEPLAKTSPMMLTVPPREDKYAKAPVLDGKLDDKLWEYAASMPRLIEGNFPRNSGALPPHSFKLIYDKDNLYLGFTTLFPPHVPLQEGDQRTADIEPEVWGYESFEFYIENDKEERFRFGGNVAGGYCETHGGTNKWNGEWTYKTTKEMKIDDTILWQGEIAIPWKTINSNGAPQKPVLFNFCRSWKLPDFGNHSSLNLSGQSYNREGCIFATFAPTATFQMLSQGNPNSGEYKQDFRLATQRGGLVTYELAVGKQDGSVVPIPLYHREFRLKAGEVYADSHKENIVLPDYDCLVYTLYDGKKVAMREIVPMKLDDNFFNVTPLFMQGKVQISLKEAVMKSKLGPAFVGTINLTDKDGKILSKVSTNEKKLELTFNRDWEAGEYRVALLDGKGAVQAEKKLSYPGYGEWEKMEFPNDMIIPPFKAIETRRESNGFTSDFAERSYTWSKSFLPTQMISQDEKLFAAPAELLLNGVPAKTTAFTVESAAKHRVDFQAKNAAATNKSWLEYDGVQWNEMTVMPAQNGTISLQFTLDARFAKYIHAVAGSTWGTKITRKVAEGDMTLKYFPIIWLGNEEKGFCFFAEVHENWTVPSSRSYTISKHGDKAIFTVHIAEKLAAKKPFSFSFGLLATPIRPLPKNYPFNTLGQGYYDALNRPGRRPTSDVSDIEYVPGYKNGDLGSYFGDIDDKDGHLRDEAIARALAQVKDSYNVRPIPYTCARYLSIKYPEMAAYKAEWIIRPEIAMDYSNTGHFVYDCCPTTKASNFFAYRAYQMFKRHPKLKGIYFDFGNVPTCSNEHHGCLNRLPILGMRDFYRKIAIAQLKAGIAEPIIVVHNTDCNMYPCYSFATHLLNGEQVRQASSSLLHNKKDILDSYGIEMFAAELSSLPLGVTNSAYMPVDTLLPKYGGDEKFGDYQFRMGKAEFAGTLIHNTIIALWRNHYGLFDKLIRTYDNFGVDKAKFIGYWREPAKVNGAENIYVSCYTRDNKVLAVVGHVGKEHKNQTFDIVFDWSKLNIKRPPKTATDTMTAPDPEYDVLKDWIVKYRVPSVRAPIKLGDFGSKVLSYQGNTLRLSLDYHCFAVIELK